MGKENRQEIKWLDHCGTTLCFYFLTFLSFSFFITFCQFLYFGPFICPSFSFSIPFSFYYLLIFLTKSYYLSLFASFLYLSLSACLFGFTSREHNSIFHEQVTFHFQCHVVVVTSLSLLLAWKFLPFFSTRQNIALLSSKKQCLPKMDFKKRMLFSFNFEIQFRYSLTSFINILIFNEYLPRQQL